LGNHKYWFYSIAQDSAGNLEHQPNSPDLSVFNADYNFLKKGWYLVSLPHLPQNDSLNYLFPSALVAYKWHNQSQVYQNSVMLDTMAGYWLAVPSAAESYSAGKSIDSFTKHYNMGWHIIGSVAEEQDFSNPNDDPDGSVIVCYGWDPAANTYYTADTLKPTQGYWIAVAQECNLTIGDTNIIYKAQAIDSKKVEAFYKKNGSVPPPPPPFPNPNGKEVPIPENYELEQNYPNPFNPTTTIKYALPVEGKTTLVIYDILGRKVKTLVNEVQPAGYYKVMWDSRNDHGIQCASGVYLFRIIAGDYQKVKKLILLR
jgi:hypothetical protein